MASNKNSSSNRTEVPEARDAMDRFKMEVADELGVNLKQGYNGNITAKEAGSIGGEIGRGDGWSEPLSLVDSLAIL